MRAFLLTTLLLSGMISLHAEILQTTPSGATNTNSSPAPIKSTAGQVAHDTEVKYEQKFWQAAFLTPITFYGKVEDEKGNPVADAKAIIMPGNTWNGSGQNYEKKTDEEGLFSIAGIHGLGVGVSVTKKGYYSDARSGGNFGYASGTGCSAPHRDPKDPAIFVLQKMGQTEPLIKHYWKQAVVAKDGAPTSLNLLNGQNTTGVNSIQIQAWVNDAGLPKNGTPPYPWKAIISVQGGGIMERKGGYYSFEATTDIYSNEIVVEMQANDPKWSTRVTKDYYFKFSDGRYARASIEFYIGGFQFVSVTSYLNPQPDHTNLEYDPEQMVKP